MSLMRYYESKEKGCLVLTLAEISILRVPDLKLTRRPRGGLPIPLLDLE